MKQETLVMLTADIVSAHASSNPVAVSDLASLVQQVHTSLAGIGQGPVAQVPQAKAPVVSPRKSISRTYLVCMECGTKYKMLRRHLRIAHQLTPQQYRQDYGLPEHYPMTSPDYSKQRSKMAKAIGLGRRGGSPK
jgi:predicted transcriptional regulator